MVADTMHLELTQQASEKGEELSCKVTLALEELGLKYLKDNIGGTETFSPICSLVSESAIKNEVVDDGSGQVMQTIALKLDLVFAFKRHFADEIEESGIRHGLRHLAVSRNLGTCNRGGHAKCCSSTAFNSNTAKGSATCGGSGCGSSRCKKKKPKKKNPKKKTPSRNLFESSTLPDLYGEDFDFVVGSYTEIHPEQTRGVVDAKSTDDVASCAVNRYIEDVLHVRSMTCRKYRQYSCIDNEDLVPDAEDEACAKGIDTVTESTVIPPVCNDNNKCTVGSWDSAEQTCVFTSRDCSSYSRYHQCDPSDGVCKPVCLDDGDKCTTDSWNASLNTCHTPVVCPNGETCDSNFGCPSCQENDKCNTYEWDYGHHACVHTEKDCSSFSRYHECDLADGICKANCVDDNDACTIDGWDESTETCHTLVGACPNGDACDPANGCTCDDKDNCTTDVWDPTTNTCSNTVITCSGNEKCDPDDG